jgi:hypothetical protein
MAEPEESPVVVVHARRRWLALPPFELWIAVAAMYAGLSYFLPFLSPAGNAQIVAIRFPNLVPVWSALYALGGFCVALGLFRRSPRVEGVGLHLLGSGATVAGMAALAAGAQVPGTIVIQGGVVAACIVRLLALRTLA